MDEYIDTVWKPWQQSILDELEGEPHKRTITWIYEREGNVGKSYLVKYICLKYDAIIADGKRCDILNQIRVWMEAHPEKSPKCLVMDIPRTSQNFVSYGLLESVKNGMAFSGKYEGGRLLFHHPHVVVFSNNFPDTSTMSRDRWNVARIADDKLNWELRNGEEPVDFLSE